MEMTRKTIGLIWLFALLVGLVAIACSSGISEEDLAAVTADLQQARSDVQAAQTQIQELEKQGADFQETATGKQIAVELAGTATGEVRTINGTELTCFDVNMINPGTGLSIGTATDCLDMASVTPIGESDGFTVVNTTFFNFEDGTIVSRSDTTVQPANDPLPSSGATHITGEIASGNNILSDMGSGSFKGATGSTRLSGAVDMSKMGEGVVTFACIFVINLAKS
jgi:hypothetical protein